MASLDIFSDAYLQRDAIFYRPVPLLRCPTERLVFIQGGGCFCLLGLRDRTGPMSFKAVTTRSIFLPPPVWEGVSGFERGLGSSPRRTGAQASMQPLEGLRAEMEMVASTAPLE